MDIGGNNLSDGANFIETRSQPDQLLALPERMDGLHQQMAADDNRSIGRAEMLLGAIDDRFHAFGDRMVLGVDALDTCVSLVLLDPTVDQPIVVFVADLAEIGGLLLLASAARLLDSSILSALITPSAKPYIQL